MDRPIPIWTSLAFSLDKRTVSHQHAFCAYLLSKAWFPYDRNDRSTTIAEIEKFPSLRSLRSRVATIAKCMFPYARKDRSDRCDHMETRLNSTDGERLETSQRILIAMDMNYWHSPAFRQKIIAYLEDAIRSGNPSMMLKNPNEMENQVYSKANSKVEYLSYIARLAVYIRGTRIHEQLQPPPTHGVSQPRTRPQLPNNGVASHHLPYCACVVNHQRWRTPAFRQKVVAQIEDSLKRSGNMTFMMKSPKGLERQIYFKSKSKVEYLSYAARLLVAIRDRSFQGQQQPQPTNMASQPCNNRTPQVPTPQINEQSTLTSVAV